MSNLNLQLRTFIELPEEQRLYLKREYPDLYNYFKKELRKIRINKTLIKKLSKKILIETLYKRCQILKDIESFKSIPYTLFLNEFEMNISNGCSSTSKNSKITYTVNQWDKAINILYPYFKIDDPIHYDAVRYFAENKKIGITKHAFIQSILLITNRKYVLSEGWRVILNPNGLVPRFFYNEKNNVSTWVEPQGLDDYEYTSKQIREFLNIHTKQQLIEMLSV